MTLLLLIAMLLPALLACGGNGGDGGGDPQGGGKKPTTIIPDEIKHMADLDFGGAEIILAVSEHTSTEAPIDSHEYITGPKRQGSDKVLNEIFNRNEVLKETLNIYPRYIYTNNNYAGVLPDLKGKLNSGSPDTPDLYIDQTYGMIRAQMEGLLMNVYNEDFTSYIDFGSKTENMNGWYNSYMNMYNFASDEKLYLLAGDYFMDVLRNLAVTVANLTDFQASFMQEGGTDLLYKTVEDGGWTLDQMKIWSDRVYKDTGSKKGVADEDDYLGILCHQRGCSGMSMLPSSGISLFKISADQKTYTVEADPNAVVAIREWSETLYSKGSLIMKSSQIPEYGHLVTTFTEGNALFVIGPQLFHLETEEMKNMQDNKCALPYPKVLKSDPYRVCPFDNARVGGIMISSQKFEEVTAWVQAACLTSAETIDLYYNEALKYKYGTEYGSTLMMDIIYENIAHPYYIVDHAICLTTGLTIDLLSIPTEIKVAVTGDNGPSTTYSSNYASIAGALREGLRIYRQRFDNLR